jgi:hypothetical protein
MAKIAQQNCAGFKSTPINVPIGQRQGMLAQQAIF